MLSPYPAPMLNAACFGATSVGVWGDSWLCYPPTLHIGQMLPVLMRWTWAFQCNPILRCPTAEVNSAHLDLTPCKHTDPFITRSMDTSTIHRPPSLLRPRPPPLPPPLPSLQAPCLPVPMRANRADFGPPRALSRNTREKEGNAQGPASRDGKDDVTRTSTTTATPTRANPKAYRPTGATSGSTRRRRKNPYPTRGHLDANYHSLEGASPADLVAVDRAPPPTLNLFALDRAPPSELRRLAHPCRPLGLKVCNLSGPKSTRQSQSDPAPAGGTQTAR